MNNIIPQTEKEKIHAHVFETLKDVFTDSKAFSDLFPNFDIGTPDKLCKKHFLQNKHWKNYFLYSAMVAADNRLSDFFDKTIVILLLISGIVFGANALVLTVIDESLFYVSQYVALVSVTVFFVTLVVKVASVLIVEYGNENMPLPHNVINSESIVDVHEAFTDLFARNHVQKHDASWEHGTQVQKWRAHYFNRYCTFINYNYAGMEIIQASFAYAKGEVTHERNFYLTPHIQIQASHA